MSMNITTPAMSHVRIEEMEAMCFSDFHKDVYGYRPRGTEWDSWVNMSTGAFNDALDSMFVKLEEDSLAREKAEEEALNILRLDVKYRLESLRARSGNLPVDWTDAFCMIMEEEINSKDVDYFLWKRGVSFTKQYEIKEKYYAAL
jgi:hypothetical protein